MPGRLYIVSGISCDDALCAKFARPPVVATTVAYAPIANRAVAVVNVEHARFCKRVEICVENEGDSAVMRKSALP